MERLPETGRFHKVAGLLLTGVLVASGINASWSASAHAVEVDNATTFEAHINTASIPPAEWSSGNNKNFYLTAYQQQDGSNDKAAIYWEGIGPLADPLGNRDGLGDIHFRNNQRGLRPGVPVTLTFNPPEKRNEADWFRQWLGPAPVPGSTADDLGWKCEVREHQSGFWGAQQGTALTKGPVGSGAQLIQTADYTAQFTPEQGKDYKCTYYQGASFLAVLSNMPTSLEAKTIDGTNVKVGYSWIETAVDLVDTEGTPISRLPYGLPYVNRLPKYNKNADSRNSTGYSRVFLGRNEGQSPRTSNTLVFNKDLPQVGITPLKPGDYRLRLESGVTDPRSGSQNYNFNIYRFIDGGDASAIDAIAVPATQVFPNAANQGKWELIGSSNLGIHVIDPEPVRAGEWKIYTVATVKKPKPIPPVVEKAWILEDGTIKVKLHNNNPVDKRPGFDPEAGGEHLRCRVGEPAKEHNNEDDFAAWYRYQATAETTPAVAADENGIVTFPAQAAATAPASNHAGEGQTIFCAAYNGVGNMFELQSDLVQVRPLQRDDAPDPAVLLHEDGTQTVSLATPPASGNTAFLRYTSGGVAQSVAFGPDGTATLPVGATAGRVVLIASDQVAQEGQVNETAPGYLPAGISGVPTVTKITQAQAPLEIAGTISNFGAAEKPQAMQLWKTGQPAPVAITNVDATTGAWAFSAAQHTELAAAPLNNQEYFLVAVNNPTATAVRSTLYQVPVLPPAAPTIGTITPLEKGVKVAVTKAATNGGDQVRCKATATGAWSTTKAGAEVIIPVANENDHILCQAFTGSGKDLLESPVTADSNEKVVPQRTSAPAVIVTPAAEAGQQTVTVADPTFSAPTSSRVVLRTDNGEDIELEGAPLQATLPVDAVNPRIVVLNPDGSESAPTPVPAAVVGSPTVTKIWQQDENLTVAGNIAGFAAAQAPVAVQLRKGDTVLATAPVDQTTGAWQFSTGLAAQALNNDEYQVVAVNDLAAAAVTAFSAATAVNPPAQPHLTLNTVLENGDVAATLTHSTQEPGSHFLCRVAGEEFGEKTPAAGTNQIIFSGAAGKDITCLAFNGTSSSPLQSALTPVQSKAQTAAPQPSAVTTDAQGQTTVTLPENTEVPAGGRVELRFDGEQPDQPLVFSGEPLQVSLPAGATNPRIVVVDAHGNESSPAAVPAPITTQPQITGLDQETGTLAATGAPAHAFVQLLDEQGKVVATVAADETGAANFGAGQNGVPATAFSDSNKYSVRVVDQENPAAVVVTGPAAPAITVPAAPEVNTAAATVTSNGTVTVPVLAQSEGTTVCRIAGQTWAEAVIVAAGAAVFGPEAQGQNIECRTTTADNLTSPSATGSVAAPTQPQAPTASVIREESDLKLIADQVAPGTTAYALLPKKDGTAGETVAIPLSKNPVTGKFELPLTDSAEPALQNVDLAKVQELPQIPVYSQDDAGNQSPVATPAVPAAITATATEPAINRDGAVPVLSGKVTNPGTATHVEILDDAGNVVGVAELKADGSFSIPEAADEAAGTLPAGALDAGNQLQIRPVRKVGELSVAVGTATPVAVPTQPRINIGPATVDRTGQVTVPVTLTDPHAGDQVVCRIQGQTGWEQAVRVTAGTAVFPAAAEGKNIECRTENGSLNSPAVTSTIAAPTGAAAPAVTAVRVGDGLTLAGTPRAGQTLFAELPKKDALGETVAVPLVLNPATGKYELDFANPAAGQDLSAVDVAAAKKQPSLNVVAKDAAGNESRPAAVKVPAPVPGVTGTAVSLAPATAQTEPTVTVTVPAEQFPPAAENKTVKAVYTNTAGEQVSVEIPRGATPIALPGLASDQPVNLVVVDEAGNQSAPTSVIIPAPVLTPVTQLELTQESSPAQLTGQAPAAASQVEVVDEQGQVVASVPVTAGSFTVPATALPQAEFAGGQQVTLRPVRKENGQVAAIGPAVTVTVPEAPNVGTPTIAHDGQVSVPVAAPSTLKPGEVLQCRVAGTDWPEPGVSNVIAGVAHFASSAQGLPITCRTVNGGLASQSVAAPETPAQPVPPAEVTPLRTGDQLQLVAVDPGAGLVPHVLLPKKNGEPGEQVAVPMQLGENGNYTLKLGDPAAELVADVDVAQALQLENLQVYHQDPAGNQSVPVAVPVPTAVTAKPTISELSFAAPETAQEQTATVRVTGEPHTPVQLLDQAGNVLATAIVGPAGVAEFPAVPASVAAAGVMARYVDAAEAPQSLGPDSEPVLPLVTPSAAQVELRRNRTGVVQVLPAGQLPEGVVRECRVAGTTSFVALPHAFAAADPAALECRDTTTTARGVKKTSQVSAPFAAPAALAPVSGAAASTTAGQVTVAADQPQPGVTVYALVPSVHDPAQLVEVPLTAAGAPAGKVQLAAAAAAVAGADLHALAGGQVQLVAKDDTGTSESPVVTTPVPAALTGQATVTAVTREGEQAGISGTYSGNAPFVQVTVGDHQVIVPVTNGQFQVPLAELPEGSLAADTRITIVGVNDQAAPTSLGEPVTVQVPASPVVQSNVAQADGSALVTLTPPAAGEELRCRIAPAGAWVSASAAGAVTVPGGVGSPVSCQRVVAGVTSPLAEVSSAPLLSQVQATASRTAQPGAAADQINVSVPAAEFAKATAAGAQVKVQYRDLSGQLQEVTVPAADTPVLLPGADPAAPVFVLAVDAAGNQGPRTQVVLPRTISDVPQLTKVETVGANPQVAGTVTFTPQPDPVDPAQTSNERPSFVRISAPDGTVLAVVPVTYGTGAAENEGSFAAALADYPQLQEYLAQAAAAGRPAALQLLGQNSATYPTAVGPANTVQTEPAQPQAAAPTGITATAQGDQVTFEAPQPEAGTQLVLQVPDPEAGQLVRVPFTPTAAATVAVAVSAQPELAGLDLSEATVVASIHQPGAGLEVVTTSLPARVPQPVLITTAPQIVVATDAALQVAVPVGATVLEVLSETGAVVQTIPVPKGATTVSVPVPAGTYGLRGADYTATTSSVGPVAQPVPAVQPHEVGTGLASAGATVTITYQTASGPRTVTVMADAQGEFATALPDALPGSQVTYVAQDVAGNVSVPALQLVPLAAPQLENDGVQGQLISGDVGAAESVRIRFFNSTDQQVKTGKVIGQRFTESVAEAFPGSPVFVEAVSGDLVSAPIVTLLPVKITSLTPPHARETGLLTGQAVTGAMIVISYYTTSGELRQIEVTAQNNSFSYPVPVDVMPGSTISATVVGYQGTYYQNSATQEVELPATTPVLANATAQEQDAVVEQPAPAAAGSSGGDMLRCVANDSWNRTALGLVGVLAALGAVLWLGKHFLPQPPVLPTGSAGPVQLPDLLGQAVPLQLAPGALPQVHLPEVDLAALGQKIAPAGIAGAILLLLGHNLAACGATSS